MLMNKDDLDKIADVLFDFFKTKRICESLEKLHKNNISGWEKWWQTELALYLSAANSIAEWDMEHPFDTDKRTGLVQARMALDIGFRLKRHLKDEWHFIELKQNNNYKKCIDEMCRDAKKVFAARKLSFDGLRVRYIACAGAFLSTEPEADLISYAEEALDRIDVDSDGMFLEPIGKYHSLLIF